MPSLKEVKTRIASVNSTRKITSAMKMVASAKLHKAQQAIGSMLPYEKGLNRIMASFLSGATGDISSPYSTKREVKQAAVVIFTSNSSLCGGFNSNAIKSAIQSIKEYEDKGVSVPYVYVFGKKAEESIKKVLGPATEMRNKSNLLDHPRYESAMNVAEELMGLYAQEDIDEVKLIYHHFKNTASQLLIEEKFLPIDVTRDADDAKETEVTRLNYIFEPSIEDLFSELLPKSLHLKLYAAMLDSLASEHAARVVAMQVATDNADELLRDLTLTYNKTRQQAITTELLDIVGGSMQ